MLLFDYILCSRRQRSSIQSAKTRQGADCGSDHELLITKFWLKLKKVGKTTRSIRYGLNKILYDYTVEAINGLEGLDLVDRVPEELWTETCNTVPKTATKIILKIKKYKKAKWLSEEANRRGKNRSSDRFYFPGLQNHCMISFNFY